MGVKNTRRMPVRWVKVQMEGDWEGWEFTIRANPPIGIFEVFQEDPPDISRLIDAFAQLIRDWNFVDEEGKPLPPPSPETIRTLPVDLLQEMGSAFANQIGGMSPN